MARIIRVKKAQQRYHTKPVLDADGNPKRVPVNRKRPTKSGREVTMRVTVNDLERPKPLLRCDFPGCDINGGEIAIGTPYKHITPMKGAPQRNRHAEHPDWNVWDYSSSFSANVARVQHDMEEAIEALDSVDDFESVKDDLTQMAQDLLDEKEESLSNMPEGLADGSVVEEQRDALEQWVSELEDVSAPDDLDEPEARWYIVDTDNDSAKVGEQGEEGYDSEEEALSDLQFLRDTADDEGEEWDESRYDVIEETPEEHSDEEIETWLEEAKDNLREAVEAVEA